MESYLGLFLARLEMLFIQYLEVEKRETRSFRDLVNKSGDKLRVVSSIVKSFNELQKRL